MTRFVSCFILLAAVAGAETEPLTRPIGLHDAMRLAMDQSPEIQLARLEVEKSSRDLAAIRAERSAQLYAGSGLGATYGIPQSIQGAVPSVASLTMRQPLVDTGRLSRAEGARETVRSGELAAEAAAEESVYRAGIQYLDFESVMREAERLGRELVHLERIERLVGDRVAEGTEIPLALSRARLETARARERLAGTEGRAMLLESRPSTHARPRKRGPAPPRRWGFRISRFLGRGRSGDGPKAAGRASRTGCTAGRIASCGAKRAGSPL